jgi:hypothetical protein
MKKGILDFKLVFIVLNLMVLPFSFYNWFVITKIISTDIDHIDSIFEILSNKSTLDCILAPQFGLPIILPRHGFDFMTTITGEKRASIDFAHVYYASKNFKISNSNFYNENHDIFGRSNVIAYTPQMLFVYKNSICLMKYNYAAILSSNLQILLLLISILLIFRSELKHAIISSLVIINILFLSPIALSWYERGQFDLFIAISFIWLLNGIIRESPVSFIISAIFACFKLTSLPTLSIVLPIYFLFKGNKHAYINTIIFAIAFITTFLPFLHHIIPFFTNLQDYELSAKPVGISLLGLFKDPSSSIILFIKLLPFIIIILYSVLFIINKSLRNKVLNRSVLIFIFAIAVLMSLYGTDNHSYRIVVLVSFIPFIYVSQMTERGYLKEEIFRLIFYLTFYILAFFPTIQWLVSRFTKEAHLIDYPLIFLFIITFLFANFVIIGNQKIEVNAHSNR